MVLPVSPLVRGLRGCNDFFQKCEKLVFWGLPALFLFKCASQKTLFECGFREMLKNKV